MYISLHREGELKPSFLKIYIFLADILLVFFHTPDRLFCLLEDESELRIIIDPIK